MPSYTVRWETSQEADSPEQAAALVWRRIFGRLEAAPDDACVFEIGLDNPLGGGFDGRQVDLSQYESLDALDPRPQLTVTGCHDPNLAHDEDD